VKKELLMMVALKVNGRDYHVEVHPREPLLWVLRERLGLMGTKFGCGKGACGACTVHVDGEPRRSCQLAVGDVAGSAITTIEGLGENHPLKLAWIEDQVPQCGYCQSGQIMHAAALIAKDPTSSADDIIRGMGSVLCRCGTYPRIKRAIRRALGHGAANMGVNSKAPSVMVGNSAQTCEFGVPLTPWIKISPDDTVTIFVSKSEMGQGVYTSLAMIVADELEADWNRVRVAASPTEEEYEDPVWGQQFTGGSTSIVHFYLPLRRAAAAAREMLITEAASRWNLPMEECAARQGKVTHHKTGRVLSYGQLASGATALPVPQRPELKNESEFRLIGKPIPRIDMRDKVSGTAGFGLDVRVQGMLYAAVALPPAFGAKLLFFDRRTAEQVPGVSRVLRTSFGVAVCAHDPFAAFTGRAALKAEWSGGSHPHLDTESVEQTLCEALTNEGLLAKRRGDADAAFAVASQRVEAVYSLPYLAHAYLEPHNCTVHVQDGRCDIWCATQNQTLVRETGAYVSGLDLQRVHVHSTYLGGGFGGKSEVKNVEQAVEIAAALKKPVKLIWTREDDMQNDFYRPGICCAIEGGLDSSGRLTAWSHRVVAPSIFKRRFPEMMERGIDPSVVEGVRDMLYAVPNLLVHQILMEDLPIPVGFWRSVGHSFAAFVKESFVDEMAHASGQDPLSFRVGLLEDQPVACRVLERVAEAANWGGPIPEGHARGIAHHFSFGSHVAQIAEASVDRQSGRVQVHKVWCAVDCGPVINPAIVTQQMEGAICMGLSAALHEQVEFARGGVKSENFSDYGLLTMSEAPDIHVDIMDSTERIGGIGEPGLPPIAPAVANAVFSATGVRLRKLPMTPQRVKQAFDPQ
jgi:isoquinoline 1-oxidoreductase subunit beta